MGQQEQQQVAWVTLAEQDQTGQDAGHGSSISSNHWSVQLGLCMLLVHAAGCALGAALLHGTLSAVHSNECFYSPQALEVILSCRQC
jgi:hypothetical protein